MALSKLEQAGTSLNRRRVSGRDEKGSYERTAGVKVGNNSCDGNACEQRLLLPDQNGCEDA